MTQNRDVRATFGYKVDQASIAAATNANKAVAASFANVQSAAATMSADVLKLNPAFAALISSTKDLEAARVAGAQQAASAQKALNLQLNEQLVLQRQITFEERQRAAFVNRSGGTGGNVGGSISRFSRGLFNLPDVQLTPGVSTTVLSRVGLLAGGGIEAAGVGIGALAAGAAIAAPAVLLVVGALSALSAQSQQASQNAKTFASALTEAFEAGSTAQVQALIKQKQQEIAIAEANQNLLLEKAKSAQLGLASFLDTTSADLAARLNQAAADIGLEGQGGDFAPKIIQTQEELNAQAVEQAKIIEQAKIAIEAYNLVFGDQIIATGDAAEAEQRLADLRERIAEAATGIQQAQLDAAIRADQLTKEQRDEQILQLEREISIRTRYAQTHQLTEEALQANAVAVDKLRNNLLELRGVVTSTGDLLEKERLYRENAAKALQDLNSAMQDEAQALDRAADIRQRMADLLTDTEEKRRNLIQDAEDRRTEIAIDGAERRQEIDTQDAERRAEILNRFNTDYSNAVGERDALAAYKAKQNRDEELDKQGKAYRKQIEQLERQLDKQLKTIERNLEKQQRSIDQAYERQMRGLQRDLDEQNAIAENARQQQIVMQRNYNALIENAEIMHRAAVYKTIYDYGEMTRIYVENLWSKIAQGARTMWENGGSVVGGPDYGVYPGASVGGNNLKPNTSAYNMFDPGIYRSNGANSRLRSVPVNSALSSSSSKSTVINFNPVINGSRLTNRQFERMADNWFYQLRRMAT